MDAVITDSESSAIDIRRIYGLPRDRLRVIYVGVDSDIFRPLELPREPNSLLFVGNSEDTNKGIRYLLEALRLLRDELRFHLTIVQWPGSVRAPRLVRQLGLHSRVTFRQHLTTEELVCQYNRAQVMVSPSLCEGFGLPAAEAQACGTPVIATTASAFPEVVQDGVTGLLVPPADARALAEAIRMLLADPERCRALGEAGRRRMVERFSWRRAGEETVALYEEVLGRTSRGEALAEASA
jgi:glycosyltransferase involved in cell wall biosynthesis